MLMINSEKFIGTIEYLTLYTRCSMNRCRYNRVWLLMFVCLCVCVCVCVCVSTLQNPETFNFANSVYL